MSTSTITITRPVETKTPGVPAYISNRNIEFSSTLGNSNTEKKISFPSNKSPQISFPTNNTVAPQISFPTNNTVAPQISFPTFGLPRETVESKNVSVNIEIKSEVPTITIQNLDKYFNTQTVKPFRPVTSNTIATNIKKSDNWYKEKLQEAKRTESELSELKVQSNIIKYFSYEELEREAGDIIINTELKTSDSEVKNAIGNILLNTVNDPRMGEYSNENPCATCYQFTENCPGHPGMIKLPKEFFHPEALPFIILILKCICRSCGKLLLTREDLRIRGILKKRNLDRLRAFVDAVKGAKCKTQTGGCVPNPVISAKKTQTTNSGKIIAEFKKENKTVTYTASEVLKIFQSFSADDIDLLGFENGATPVNLILRGLYVIPTISRPPAIRDGKITPHDLTMMYDDIVKCNNLLADEIKKNREYEENKSSKISEITKYQNFDRLTETEKHNIIARLNDELIIITNAVQKDIRTKELKGYMNVNAKINSLKNELNKITAERSASIEGKSSKHKTEDELYIELYYKIQHLMDSSDGTNTKNGTKQYKGIKEAINGKEEIIRGLLMGKRVNFAARTVLSPDPSLKFGQIRLPKVWESILTIPMKVFKGNLGYVRKLYELKKIGFITKKEGPDAGARISSNSKIYANLIPEIGDKVERFLENGDIVIFNRQPTIQKESMMGYEVVLGSESTIGLHPSVCKAHNADNDGDEGNIHVMQTTAAILEVHRILNTKQCIMNAQSNRNMINVHMDPVQAAFVLTRDKGGNKILDDDVYYDCLEILSVKTQLIDLENRLNKYSVLSKSGYALMSALFEPDFFYSKGNVRIIEGVMVAGIITTDHLGTSSGSLIEAMYKQYGTDRASKFISDANLLLNRYALDVPFSVSYSDCLVDDFESHKQMVTEKTIAAAIAVNQIEKNRELRRRKEILKGKKENLLEAEREEKEIISILNNTRNVGARTAEKYLGPNNGFNISALSKVKGDNFNIAQIIDLVGQQFINSKRLPKAMTGGTRCSPYFAPGDTSIESQGFCTGNYFEGLSPAEQFFQQTGSRENTVESTIKVPTSGDINHRMVKNFEDITLQNNGTVTNSRDRIIQFAYEDGFNSSEMNPMESRMGKNLSFMNFKVIADKLNVKYGYEVSNPKYEMK